MSNVEPLVRPFLRVVKVVYFTDMTRAAGRVIALGAFAEIMLQHVHGLALKARTTLLAPESQAINPLFRERLADPFAYLRAEFQLAIEKAHPGEAINFLTGRHAASLSVLAPRDVEQGSWWSSLFRARNDAVELKLSDAVEREFANLLKANGDPSAPKRMLIEVDDMPAATDDLAAA